MLKTILSVAGRPGLFRLVSQGKNMLIVESLQTGKRGPVYAHDKVVSLGDIAIYTYNDEMPLSDIFETIKDKNESKAVDVKALGGDEKIREYFATILPDFDQDRVYTNDIKKVFSWYNQLIAAGFDKFKDDEIKKEEATKATDSAEEK